MTKLESGRSGTVESQLRRGLNALEELAARPQTAAELARQLGVNRSTALRLLQELEGMGYVTRDEASKRFSIAVARLYGLIASRDDHWDWAELVDSALVRIRDEYGEAAMQAVPAGEAMVYLAFFPSKHPVAVREQIGTLRPMHCSALGKAYLSALDEASLEAQLPRLSYRGGTRRAPTGPDELRERLTEARGLGFAIDGEETYDGVVCVAVPMRIGGALVGAAGISGPAHRLPPERVEEIGHALGESLSSLAAVVQL
jgi:DNA-binding IclR family transcriptional regulator